MWHPAFIELVRSDYERRRLKNSRYSLRAYAKALGLSPGAVFRLFRNDIEISSERALEIMQRLEIPALDQNQIRFKMEVPLAPLPKTPWPENASELLRDWRHVAVLVALQSKMASSENALAKILRTDVAAVEEIVRRLAQVGLIERDVENEWRPNENLLKAGDAGPASDIRRHHLDSLELAARSLELPLHERDFSSLTFSGNTEQIEIFRKEIRVLLDRMVATVEAAPIRDKVMRISIQLFPITF